MWKNKTVDKYESRVYKRVSLYYSGNISQFEITKKFKIIKVKKKKTKKESQESHRKL